MEVDQSSPLVLQIEGRRLSDEVTDALRDAIISGRLEPGTRLLEIDLAASLGVSRASVRTAIQQLDAEGLVSTTPRKGSVVAELSEHDLEEIHTIRRALETLAVERLVGNIEQWQVDALENVVKETEAALEARDVARVVRLGVKFHELICLYSGHTRVYKFWLQISHQLLAFFTAADPFLEPELNASRHRELIAAIQSGDKVLAVETFHQHINNGVRRLSKKGFLRTPEQIDSMLDER